MLIWPGCRSGTCLHTSKIWENCLTPLRDKYVILEHCVIRSASNPEVVPRETIENWKTLVF